MKLLIFALIVLPVVVASGISTALTTAVIEGSDAAITAQYSIASERIEDLQIYLPDDVQKITAKMDDTERTCKIENNTAYCGSTKAGNHVFTVAYRSSAVLGTLNSQKVFKLTNQLPFRTNENTVVLKLAPGQFVAQEANKDPNFFITPKPAEVISDGQRIIIVWKDKNVESISVSAVIDATSTLWVWVSVITGIMIFAGVLATYVRKKKSADVHAPQFIENEQKVVELLAQAENKTMWQKQLLKEAGFSKAKLSRIIRNLEERNVVSKTAYGNTNKIALR